MQVQTNQFVAGDHGEDDSMGMEMDYMAFDDPKANTSDVSASERRDRVPSQLYYADSNTIDRKVSPRKEVKSKSMVLGKGGNKLKVRGSANNSNNASNTSMFQPRASAKTVDNLDEEFDYFYKIIVVGDEITGKTNFLQRCVNGSYDPKPKTTYGVEFLFKTVPLPDSNQKVKT